MLARAAIKTFRDEKLERMLGDEFLLNVDQAALYLAVSASTLNHWRSDGKGPKFVKLCGSTRGAIRYRVADLRAYVAANTFESVAEAELAAAMSRVSPHWDDWTKLHPFVTKSPHFLLDSALADSDTFAGVFFDPAATVRWMRPATALQKPWLRPERRLELLGAYLNSAAGYGQRDGLGAAYLRELGKIPEQLWCGHPDLTLKTLRETAGGQQYPIEIGPSQRSVRGEPT
jgi:hypothetical protein